MATLIRKTVTRPLPAGVETSAWNDGLLLKLVMADKLAAYFGIES